VGRPGDGPEPRVVAEHRRTVLLALAGLVPVARQRPSYSHPPPERPGVGALGTPPDPAIEGDRPGGLSHARVTSTNRLTRAPTIC
jgi:hypothetical protein